MTRTTHVLVLLLALIGATSAAQRPVFRSEVDLIPVDVSVTREGHPVAGLNPENFIVMDNGAPQKVERLVVESMPLDITFVLDSSGSVAGQKFNELVGAARLFAGRLGPDDRLGLIGFSQTLVAPSPLTRDHQVVVRRLTETRAAGFTALRDAVYAALRLPEPGPARAVAVVFSDGIDNISWLAQEDVEDAADRSDVIVYGVTATQRWEARVVEYAPQDRFLRGIAARTGGAASWHPGDSRSKKRS